MRYGSPSLAEYPARMVRLACNRCDRRGQYRKDRLIAEHGADPQPYDAAMIGTAMTQELERTGPDWIGKVATRALNR